MTGPRRVNELAVADVDAHMAKSLAQGVIKHQIPRLQIFDFDILCDLGLVFGAPG